MSTKRKSLLLAALLALGVVTPIWTMSHAAYVSTLYFGPGKMPKNTALETVVGEQLSAPTALCVFVGRNGRGKNNARVDARLTIYRSGVPQSVRTRANLVYRPAIDDSIACTCVNLTETIDRGDRIHAAYKLRGLQSLTPTETGRAELLALEGLMVPAGFDCSTVFP